MRHLPALEQHGARGRHLEAGDHAQDRRLARPGRSEHREELAVADDQVDGVDRHDVAELLAQVHELDGGRHRPGACGALGAGSVSVTAPPSPRMRPGSTRSATIHVPADRPAETDPAPPGPPTAARHTCGRDPLGEDLGRAAWLHRDADEAVGRLHRALLVADDEQLGVGPELGDEPEEAVKVDVVERGLHLVHHVEGRRAAPEHGEQEGQRGEGPLAARQQRQLLHVLARRLGLDLDAGREQVLGFGEDQPPGAAREQRREQRGEVLADVGEGGGEDRLDLGVDRADDPLQVPPGRCGRPPAAARGSRWRSCRAVNSSRASGLIGPIRRISRSRSRTRAAGVTPSARGGCSVRHGRRRLGVELAPDVLDRGLQPRARPRPPRSRQRRCRSPTSASCRSASARSTGAAARAPAWPPGPRRSGGAARSCSSVRRSSTVRGGARPARPRRSTATAERSMSSTARRPASACARTAVGQAALDVLQPLLQHGGPLLDPGGPHGQVPAAGGERLGPLLPAAPLPRGAGAPRPPPVASSASRASSAAPARRWPRPPGPLLLPAPRARLGPRSSASPSSCRSRCRRSSVAVGPGGSASCGLEPRRGDRTARPAPPRRRRWRQRGRPSSRRRPRRRPCGAGPRPARRPSPPRRPVRGGSRRRRTGRRRRVTTTTVGWARARSSASDHGPSTATRLPEQIVQQAATRVGRRPARVAGRGAPGVGPPAGRVAAPAAAQDAAAHVDPVEMAERTARHARRPPRRPRPAPHRARPRRRPPTAVDLHQVQQRAEHAVDVARGARRPPGPGRRPAPGRAPRPGRAHAVAARPRPRAAAPRVLGGRPRRACAAPCCVQRASTSGASASSACRDQPRRPRRPPVELGVPVGQRRQRRLGREPGRSSSACAGPLRRAWSSPRTSAAARAARVASGRPAVLASVPSAVAVGRRARRPPRSTSSSSRACSSGSRARRASATAASSDRSRAASASRLAATLASMSCTRSRSRLRRRSSRTADSPRARSRSCSTRTSASPTSRRAAWRRGGPRRPGRRCPSGPAPAGSRPPAARSCRRSSRQRLASRRCSAGDLPTGHVDPQAVSSPDHLAVAAGRLGLALQRAQLAADLPQQVLDPQQAAPPWRPAGARPAPCACGT